MARVCTDLQQVRRWFVGFLSVESAMEGTKKQTWDGSGVD